MAMGCGKCGKSALAGNYACSEDGCPFEENRKYALQQMLKRHSDNKEDQVKSNPLPS